MVGMKDNDGGVNPRYTVSTQVNVTMNLHEQIFYANKKCSL
jgi:hypothetical protein